MHLHSNPVQGRIKFRFRQIHSWSECAWVFRWISLLSSSGIIQVYQILFKCELRSTHAPNVATQRGELSGNTSQVNSERFKMNKWWKGKCVSGSLVTQAPDGLCLMMCSGHSAQVFPSRRCNQTLSMSMTTIQWQENQDLLIRWVMAQHGSSWLGSDYCEILLDVHWLLRLLSISKRRQSHVSHVNIWGWDQIRLSSNYL